YSFAAPKKAFPQAQAAALQALALDETLAEAHVSLGFAKFLFDWDWSGARHEFQRALELNAGSSHAHHWYAWYLVAIGSLKEAHTGMHRAQELDPLSLPINTNVGFVYYFAGAYDQAAEHFRRTLDMDANFPEAQRGLGLALQQQGRLAEAITAFHQAR